MKFPKFRKRKSDAGPEKADQPQQSLPDQKVGSSLGDILAPRGQPPAPAQPPANPGDAILSSAPAQPPASPGDAILSPAPAQPPANPGDAILSSAPAQPVADPGDAILSPASVQPPAALDAGPSPSPAGDASPEAPPDPAADAQTGTATDTPGESAAPPNEPDAADDALAGLGDSDEEESSDDLLDIFKEAKEEVEESSLTAGLDDIPIVDLMSDVSSMSKHLGVAPKPPNVKRVPATGTPVPDVPAAAPAAIPVAPDEAPVEQPVVPPAQPAASPEPIPEADPGTPPATVTRVEQKPEPPVAPDAIVPPAAGGETLQAAPPARQSDASAASSDAIKAPGASSAPRQQMLHVLLIGLSLTLMAGLLGIGAAGGGPTDLLAASASEPTPAVLAYLRVPVLPVTEITSTPAPTPVPTQEPTPVAAQEPTPSPSPTPVPVRTAADFGFDPLAPAFYNYTVEFGDSLTSISQQFDICPDQILWNNKDRDENTPLYVGDSLVLPGTTGIVHTVRPGESVETLAGRYSVDPDAIVAYPGNHLSPGDALIPGSRLLMPGGVPPGALLQDEDEYADTHYPSPAGYVWPYSGPITTYYGEQRPGYTHNAIDIGGLGTYGQPVVASAAGSVVSVQYDDPAYGNNLIVDHGDGTHTRYAHLADINVAQGEFVEISQPVGTIGCTGLSTGTHVHFELWQNGAPIDPLPLLP